MSLIRFEPLRGLDVFGKRMNEIFGELERGVRFEIGSFNPRVDITEDEKSIHLHAELPGMTKEDVKVTVSDDNVLTVRGEKKREQKTEDKNFVRIERSFGEFTRAFTLPANINGESINATFDNGILEVKLEKKVPSKPKETNVSIN